MVSVLHTKFCFNAAFIIFIKFKTTLSNTISKKRYCNRCCTNNIIFFLIILFIISIIQLQFTLKDNGQLLYYLYFFRSINSNLFFSIFVFISDFNCAIRCRIRNVKPLKSCSIRLNTHFFAGRS